MECYLCPHCGKNFTLPEGGAAAFCPYCGENAPRVSAPSAELQEALAVLRARYEAYAAQKAPTEKKRTSFLEGLHRIVSGTRPGQEAELAFFHEIEALCEKIAALCRETGETDAAGEAMALLLEPRSEKEPQNGLMLIACEGHAAHFLPLLSQEELRRWEQAYAARFGKKPANRPFPVQQELLNKMRQEIKG